MRGKKTMKTVKETLNEAKDFGMSHSRVVLVGNGRVKADYCDAKPLEEGKLFDSCLKVKESYSVGSAAILFVEEPFPMDGIDAFMSKRMKKWKSYTVERNGKVVVTLVGGAEITGRSFNELIEKMR